MLVHHMATLFLLTYSWLLRCDIVANSITPSVCACVLRSRASSLSRACSVVDYLPPMQEQRVCDEMHYFLFAGLMGKLVYQDFLFCDEARPPPTLARASGGPKSAQSLMNVGQDRTREK